MADNEHKVFNFRDASAELGIQPSSAPAGSFPLLAGVDGRFADVLRRYPGHTRYSDSTDALGATQSAAVFMPTFVRPFEIQKKPGSQDKVRGFVVYDKYNGGCELWYRFSTDTAGVLRKFALTQTGGCLFRCVSDSASTATPNTDHTPQPAASGIGEPTTYFNGAVFTHQECRAFCAHDDGTGEALYAAGIFRFAGDRHCPGVARWDGTRWLPLADSFFNETITSLCSHDGKLYVGGAFTGKGSATGALDSSFKYIACWDRTTGWSTLGGGTDGTVLSLVSFGAGNGLAVGGLFTNVEDTPGDTPNQAAAGLAKWNPTTLAWTGSTRTLTGAGVGIYAMLYSGSTLYVGGDFTQMGGVANTSRIAMTDSSFSAPTAMGTGAADGAVYALATANSQIYAGGSFTAMGGVGSTNLIARWSGAAWQAGQTGTAFTSGTIRTLYATYVSSTTLVIAGGINLLLAGVTQGVWYQRGTPGVSFVWTHPVNFPTSTRVNNILAQAEWNQFHYYGGYDQGSALSLNPVAAPQNSSQVPTADGPRIDIATHDRYIFLGASNGVKKVLQWDNTNSTWLVSSFGPGLMQMQGLVAGDVVANAGVGRLGTGSYTTYFRYYDPERSRWTALSGPCAEDPETTPYYLELRGQETRYDLLRAPEGFTKAEIFSTIASTDIAIPGGGSIYRVARGSLNATTRRFTAEIGQEEFIDYGNGEFHWALSDESIPDPSRAYNIDVEETGELGDIHALGTHQGMTFALEARDGILQLRWSNTYRTEWENFAPLNSYTTNIRVEDTWSCRFISAGDYLYLVGGDQIFRIQRVGVSLSIVKVFSGLSIIHNQGVAVVGNQLYIVTQQGLLIVDPRSAQGAILKRLSRVFWDRWRNALLPGDPSYSVSLAYDAQMECLYIHNTALKECVCLWLNTGKTTLLFNTASEMLVSFPDIDSDMGERAYFFTKRRWFTYPAWNNATGGTMSGNPAGLASFNLAVVTSALDTSCTHYTANRYKLTFTGTPFGTSCLAPMAIMALTGSSKGSVFQVVGNNSSSLWLASVSSAPAAGDVVAFSPVTTLVMGSMPWNDRGQIQPSARKIVKGHSVTVARTSGETTPPTGSSMVQFGTFRNANFTNSEPMSVGTATNSTRAALEITGPEGAFITPYSEVDGPLDQALDTDKEASNWTRKNSDGTLLYPWMMFRTSNYGVEVLYWDVLASVESSFIAGPGTL